MPTDQAPWPSGPPWARHPLRAPRVPWVRVAICVLLQLPVLAMALHLGLGLPWAPIASVAAIAGSLVLLAGRLAPGPVVVAAAVLCVASIGFSPGPPLAAVPVAVAVAGAVFAGRWIWAWAVLGGLAVLGSAGWIVLTGVPIPAGRVVIVTLALCLVAAVAAGARGRRERWRAASRAAADRTERVAEAERLRIARELHDILAHSLSEISVQAGVGLHLFDSQPEQAREALAAIRSTSGSALDEVRSVLGVLRDGAAAAPHSPEPALDQFDDIVAAAERLGVVVTVYDAIPLEARPGAAVQVALYRIAQEAVTNAARHSAAAVARIDLDRHPGGVRLRVRNPASPSAPQLRALAADDRHSAGAGRGLVGMRERAELLGGTLTAGPEPDGGWCVTAVIPVRARGKM